MDHPYILKFIPVDEREKSRPYIVTEYLSGYTMAHLLNNVRPCLRKMRSNWPDASVAPLPTCMRRRCPPGLKPQNIMICYDGTIRIMDFGIAKASKGEGSRSRIHAFSRHARLHGA